MKKVVFFVILLTNLTIACNAPVYYVSHKTVNTTIEYNIALQSWKTVDRSWVLEVTNELTKNKENYSVDEPTFNSYEVGDIWKD